MNNIKWTNEDGTEKKLAYVIIDTQLDKGEYVPCIVVEGESGYFLTDWRWGKDRNIAQRLADERNARMRISPEEAMGLVLKSMRFQINANDKNRGLNQ